MHLYIRSMVNWMSLLININYAPTVCRQTCTDVTFEMHLHTPSQFFPSRLKNISARVSFGSHSPQSLQECQVSKTPPPSRLSSQWLGLWFKTAPVVPMSHAVKGGMRRYNICHGPLQSALHVASHSSQCVFFFVRWSRAGHLGVTPHDFKGPWQYV